MKHCPKCDETKPLTKFYPAPGRKDGYSGWCKDCKKLSEKKAYKKVYGATMTMSAVRQKSIKQDALVKYGSAVADILESTDWAREDY